MRRDFAVNLEPNMKTRLILALAAFTLAACDARVNVPPAENKTTIVNPPSEKKETTIVNPPAEKKTETTTTTTPGGTSVQKTETTR